MARMSTPDHVRHTMVVSTFAQNQQERTFSSPRAYLQGSRISRAQTEKETERARIERTGITSGDGRTATQVIKVQLEISDFRHIESDSDSLTSMHCLLLPSSTFSQTCSLIPQLNSNQILVRIKSRVKKVSNNIYLAQRGRRDGYVSL